MCKTMFRIQDRIFYATYTNYVKGMLDTRKEYFSNNLFLLNLQHCTKIIYEI